MPSTGVILTTAAEFQAFNTELAALLRAGLPLEPGLRALANTGRGSLASLSRRVSQQLHEGRSLVDALRSEDSPISATYAATIEAAMRAGELPLALEALGRFGRTGEDIRQRIRLAMLYPRIVMLAAYLLFGIFLSVSYPRFMRFAWEEYGAERSPLIEILDALSGTMTYWFWPAPIVAWLLWQGFTMAVSSVNGAGRFETVGVFELARRGFWLPGVARVYDDLEASQVAGLLSLMVRHSVPLPEALELVARSVTSSTLRRGLLEAAAGLRQGAALSAASLVRGLPRFLGETLFSEKTSARLADNLEQAATIYQRRALRHSEWIRVVFPTLVTFIVGGGIVLLYVLAIMLPIRAMYTQIFMHLS